MLTASLPMYTRPALDAANAALWAGIRDACRERGIAAPDALSPDGFGYGFWENPHLLLSQTCGYPYRVRLAGKVGFVGTPDYGLPGCARGYYYSVFVARAAATDDLSALSRASFATNSRDSQSGYIGPLRHAAMLGVQYGPIILTGSHAASARAVAAGQADIAAIDAVTWRHIKTYDSFAADLQVIGQTRPVPGLPLITGQPALAEVIREAVTTAIAQQSPATKELGIVGMSGLGPADYTPAAFGDPPEG